jgi:hypothetical protein
MRECSECADRPLSHRFRTPIWSDVPNELNGMPSIVSDNRERGEFIRAHGKSHVTERWCVHESFRIRVLVYAVNPRGGLGACSPIATPKWPLSIDRSDPSLETTLMTRGQRAIGRGEPVAQAGGAAPMVHRRRNASAVKSCQGRWRNSWPRQHRDFDVAPLVHQMRNTSE